MPRTKGKPPRVQPGGLSERLRAMLRALDLSAYEIGLTAGVDRRNVSNFLAGRNKLTGESMDRICEAYGFALVDTRAGRRTRAARPAKDGIPGAGVDSVPVVSILPSDADD